MKHNLQHLYVFLFLFITIIIIIITKFISDTTVHLSLMAFSTIVVKPSFSQTISSIAIYPLLARYCHYVHPSIRLPVCPSVCLSGTGVHCDHTVHISADLRLRLDSPMFRAPGQQSMSTYSHPSFSSSTWKTGGVWMCKLKSRTPEDRGQATIECKQLGSHIYRVDWHNNG